MGYTGMMDEKAIEYGLSAIKENVTVEALIHPCSFFESKLHDSQHQIEFNITQNKDLKDKIERMGFEITNYKE